MADKSDKKKKDKKGKKGKDAGGKGTASVASHPRAAAAVRRAKGFGGLGGFALAALLSRKAGLTPAEMLERALIAGVAGYVIAWGCAVAVWRHLVVAEMRAAFERHRELNPKRTISMASAKPAAAPEEAAPAAAAGAPPAG